MISVMMSNSNGLESEIQNDAVQGAGANNFSTVGDGDGDGYENRGLKPESLLGLLEKVEDSIVPEEEARASDNRSKKISTDFNLGVDVRGSEETRDSKEVDEGTDFRVCKINEVDKKSDVDVNNSKKFELGKKEMKEEGEENGKVVEVRNGKMERKKKSSALDYNSMLSMFDEFAQNVNSCVVGCGFEIGDMVWGKVKSHPWWPGHIYNEAFASASVRRSKTEGHVLVAFFGDSSYGWFDAAELIPFEPNFVEKSKQTNSKTFVKAVEEAIDEVSRRSGLGLVCKCRNPYSFRPTSVKGFFAVDVDDFEPGEIFSASQIKKARDSFRPQEMLTFLKQFARKPGSDGYGSINFVKHKASVLTYRKAVYEEFDETYAHAFGVQPERPEPKTAADLSREQSRAPLSGRQVFADTIGKAKASGKPTKGKQQVEKDRYLFKRRDEISKTKTHKATHGRSVSSGQPVQTDGSLSGKGMPSSRGDQVPRDAGSEASNQSAPVAAHGHNVNPPIDGDQLYTEGSSAPSEVAVKRVKANKRPAGELNSGDPGSLEKKKKRKKELATQMSSGSTPMLAPVGKVGVSMAKVAGELVQITPAAEGDSKIDNQGKVPGEKPVLAPAEGLSKMENQKKDDAATASVLPPLQQTIGNRNTEVELRKLLKDLHALALDPFNGVNKSNPAPILRKVFLKFRSVVYQKSLGSLEPTETKSREPHTGKSSATAAASGDLLPVKPHKLSSRPGDPTLGGRKRGPSDRLEEIAVKKRKKFNDVKSLAAERKAAQKSTETPRGDTKEMPVKPSARSGRLEAAKRTESVVKTSNPTMLIMKFPPGGALPSLPELKAKFTRFGPLDPNKLRVFWQTSQCRLVYQQKSHAQAALNFVTGTNSPFGCGKVQCYLRDLSVDTLDLSAKVQTSTPVSQTPRTEQRDATKLAHQLQQSNQLKSCLKRPSGDEGGPTNGGSSNSGGGGRGARVKFVLGGEESSRSEHLTTVDNRILDNNAPSYADGGASSSSHANAMDINSKSLQSVIPPQPHLSSQSPINIMHYNDGSVSRNVRNVNTPPQPSTTNIDISQQMLSLLIKCNDVVTNLKGLLGYLPYQNP